MPTAFGAQLERSHFVTRPRVATAYLRNSFFFLILKNQQRQFVNSLGQERLVDVVGFREWSVDGGVGVCGVGGGGGCVGVK